MVIFFGTAKKLDKLILPISNKLLIACVDKNVVAAPA
jgi:hypothetical protein